MVCGPASSGNRYMVQLLLDVGCDGVSGHRQPVDDTGFRVKVPDGEPPLIAFHRSYPHSTMWPDVSEIKKALDGYELTVIVMKRARNATKKSQLKAGHVTSLDEADEKIDKARKMIAEQIAEAGVPWFEVDYQALSKDHQRASILESLGLAPDQTTEFVDGDVKYAV